MTGVRRRGRSRDELGGLLCMLRIVYILLPAFLASLKALDLH